MTYKQPGARSYSWRCEALAAATIAAVEVGFLVTVWCLS